MGIRDSTVIARFLDRVTPVTVTLPIGKTTIDPKRLPAAHWIDEEINQTLSLLRLEPAPAAEEAVFLRRLTLALTGTLPSTPPRHVGPIPARTPLAAAVAAGVAPAAPYAPRATPL